MVLMLSRVSRWAATAMRAASQRIEGLDGVEEPPLVEHGLALEPLDADVGLLVGGGERELVDEEPEAEDHQSARAR
jgi:hypothetical protein